MDFCRAKFVRFVDDQERLEDLIDEAKGVLGQYSSMLYEIRGDPEGTRFTAWKYRRT